MMIKLNENIVTRYPTNFNQLLTARFLEKINTNEIHIQF
jgi:hypothetical protein